MKTLIEYYLLVLGGFLLNMIFFFSLWITIVFGIGFVILEMPTLDMILVGFRLSIVMAIFSMFIILKIKN